MLGKAHAWRSSNAAVAEAYEACASMVTEFISQELGREGDENDDPK